MSITLCVWDGVSHIEVGPTDNFIQFIRGGGYGPLIPFFTESESEFFRMCLMDGGRELLQVEIRKRVTTEEMLKCISPDLSNLLGGQGNG